MPHRHNENPQHPFKLILQLLPYLWIKDWRFQLRVFTSAFLIITTMVLNISIPLILRKIIASFTSPAVSTLYIQFLLLAYGFLWLSSQVTSQLREIVLFRVMERGIHLISIRIFSHLHTLSLRFL